MGKREINNMTLVREEIWSKLYADYFYSESILEKAYKQGRNLDIIEKVSGRSFRKCDSKIHIGIDYGKR